MLCAAISVLKKVNIQSFISAKYIEQQPEIAESDLSSLSCV